MPRWISEYEHFLHKREELSSDASLYSIHSHYLPITDRDRNVLMDDEATGTWNQMKD